MHPDKYLRPDGFNLAFYHRFWSLIGGDDFHTCTKRLAEGRFWDYFNHTHIILIPKYEVSSSMRDLRLMSLCNILYKIIANVLANRLKLVLNKLISSTQSIFVTGWSIIDNVLVAFEIIHHMKRKSMAVFMRWLWRLTYMQSLRSSRLGLFEMCFAQNGVWWKMY